MPYGFDIKCLSLLYKRYFCLRIIVQFFSNYKEMIPVFLPILVIFLKKSD